MMAFWEHTGIHLAVCVVAPLQLYG